MLRAPTVILALAGLAACTGAQAATPQGPGPATAPAADPGPVAEALVRATVPAVPRQVTFGWELDERGARFRGRGVARYDAPERFRLDLFGPRGETYLAAALVGDTPRIPPAVQERFPLPSAALLWAAVGVVRPPTGARLAGASTSGDESVVRYEAGEDVFEYRARAGALRQLRRLRRGGVQESVEITAGAQGVPAKVEYRDWVVLRTLTLSPENVADVAQFPEDTWTPPGTGR